jgi:hypothetical protein
MKSIFVWVLSGLALTAMQPATAQGAKMSLPKTVEAGNAFSVQTTGGGNATLYLIGPEQVLKRDVQLGHATVFSAGSVYNAGRYLVVLIGDSSTESGTFDVIPARKPADLSFLARPSRLPVGLHDGITGAVYVFDAYENLITAPGQVSFELSSPSDTVQKRIVETHDGAAWTAMDSTAQQGVDKFQARIDDVSSTRVVEQVPGDPCGLKMSASQSGHGIELVTDPVRDCKGNAVPDGTIVTFTEAFGGGQSMVDVPLKRGIAKVQMSGHEGATISVASGVVLGNQIRWGK